MLELKDVKSQKGEFTLEVPSLKLEPGRIHGLVAPSGSGKSTLLETIAGTLWTEVGDILLEGKKLNRPPQPLLMRYDEVALVHQNMDLDLYHNVHQNLSLMRLDLDLQGRNALATEWLEYCGLTEFADRLPEQLSGGQRQRLAITRLLIQEPKVILLDEPFSHQDLEGSELFATMMVDHARETNAVVLWASHDRLEILRYCDHLLSIQDGEAMYCGEISDIYDHPAHEHAEVLGPVQQLEVEGKMYRFRAHHARISEDHGWQGEVLTCWPTDSGWMMKALVAGQEVRLFARVKPEGVVRVNVDEGFVVSSTEN